MMKTIMCITVFVLFIGAASAFPMFSEADGIVPEEDMMQANMNESPPTGKLDVLGNLVKLKAYCLAAWDDARMLEHQSAGKYGALLDFVVQYGQEGGGVDRGGRKGTVDNIVSEYSDLVAALHNKYGTGVNAYLLDQIDHTIRTDPNGVVYQTKPLTALGGGGRKGHKWGRLMAFRTKALGLESRPNVVVEMACKYPDYLHFKTLASKQAENADAIAATMFFKSKAAGRYKSFLQTELAKVHRRMKQEFDYTAKASYVAEKDAFEQSYEADRKAFFAHVGVQAPAGAKAAKKAAANLPWTPPSMDKMKAIAKAHREAFMKKFKKKHGTDMGKMVKEMINEVGGVKFYFTTGTETDAESTMKPTVEFVGKKSSTKGQLRVVPGKGHTFVQHFKIETPLEEIKQVIITAPQGDQKWNCAHSKVRIGGKDGKIVSLITDAKKGEVASKSFWLKAGEKMVLVPDKNEASKNEYEKAQCMGWKETGQCDAKGPRDPEGDRGCTDEIDSAHSGYCQCDSGRLARLDCGHDTFTCKDICMT